jgi:hypothetical protein
MCRAGWSAMRASTSVSVLRIETVELGAFDQRVDRGGAAAAGIGAGKQVILATNGTLLKSRMNQMPTWIDHHRFEPDTTINDVGGW